LKINLLIAEDETSIRTSISEFISQLGEPYHLAGSASNGEEALKNFTENNIHILITDIRMPKMDGFELIRRMKELSPDSKIIILSGYDDFEYARKAIHLGVSEFLLKPIKEDDLIASLVKVTSMINNAPNAINLMVNQEKWDMKLIRLESQMFEAIEIGNCEAAKAASDKLFLGFLEKVEEDPFKLILFILDSLKSLRKRISSIETVQTYYDLEVNKLISLLSPQMPQAEIKNSLQDFILFCTKTVDSCRKQSCPDVVFQCKEIMTNYYARPLTLSEAAQMIGVTSSYLSRVFKKEFGVKFTDYLNQIRIEKAKEFLTNPHIKVLEISEKVGFNNAEYFTRIFKRHTGITPVHYRSKRVSG
jgi:two-component system response regulator YesN